MNNVCLGSQYLFSVSEKMETLFHSFCAAHNISCQKGKEGEFILFSPLRGLTVALAALDREDGRENGLLSGLAAGLKSLGALVLYTTKDTGFNKLLRVLNVQILLSFTENTDKEDKGRIRFFYSLRHRAESQRIIAAIVRQMAGREKHLYYEIPGFIDYFLNIRHFRFYLSETPSILLEINWPNQEREQDIKWKEEINDAVLKGLLQLYGKPPSMEEFSLAKEIMCLCMGDPKPYDGKSEAETAEEREASEPIGHLEQVCGDDIPGDIVAVEYQLEESEPDLAKDIKELQEESLPEYPTAAEKNILKESSPRRMENSKRMQAAASGKKSRHRHAHISSLFPPPDGPVYQFNFQPKAEELYSNISGIPRYDTQLPPTITPLFSDMMTSFAGYKAPTPQTMKARHDLMERIEAAKALEIE